MSRQNIDVYSDESERSASEQEPSSSDSDDDFPEQMNMPTLPSTTENSVQDDETVEQQEREPMLHRSTRQRCHPDWYGNVVTLQSSESEVND